MDDDDCGHDDHFFLFFDWGGNSGRGIPFWLFVLILAIVVCVVVYTQVN